MMGVAPSLDKALETMDDEQLITIFQQAYCENAPRMDKILTIAKMRYLQNGGTLVSTADAAQSTTATNGAASVPQGIIATSAAADSSTEAPSGLALPTLPQPPPTTSLYSTVGTSTVGDHLPLVDGMPPTTDRMAALWTFQGHTLRQLRSGLTTKKRGLPDTATPDQPQSDADTVDADGNPILHGSCGREKKYARCSVCYFRGVRCNTAHYCACCQRPVCVRPRKYPGEEHPKICWNVLHVDKDMIQRVDKRRARKLHAASLVLTDKTMGSEGEEEEEDVSLLATAKKSSSDEGLGEPAAKQRKITDGKTPSPFPSPRPPLMALSPSIPLTQDIATIETTSTDTAG